MRKGQFKFPMDFSMIWIIFKKLFFFIPIVLVSSTALCQQMILLSPLENTINESSGLININQKLITHNDSGGKPILYEFDTTAGNPDAMASWN